jgi:hypothetical protein
MPRSTQGTRGKINLVVDLALLRPPDDGFIVEDLGSHTVGVLSTGGHAIGRALFSIQMQLTDHFRCREQDRVI